MIVWPSNPYCLDFSGINLSIVYQIIGLVELGINANNRIKICVIGGSKI
jgi:hypothetical protein